jgi:hypothetical protein
MAASLWWSSSQLRVNPVHVVADPGVHARPTLKATPVAHRHDTLLVPRKTVVVHQRPARITVAGVFNLVPARTNLIVADPDVERCLELVAALLLVKDGQLDFQLHGALVAWAGDKEQLNLNLISFIHCSLTFQGPAKSSGRQHFTYSTFVVNLW